MTFADKAINYFSSLTPPKNLPNGTCLMNPYEKDEVKRVVVQFYKNFYSDENQRVFIIGINPGRFGGGLTGISFTDPVALTEHCKIENEFGNRKELSSQFIYNVICSYGGTEKFFSKYFLTALFPLAIIKDGKNYNYYNDPKHIKSLYPHLLSSLKDQARFGAIKKYAVCLGKKNAKYLIKINNDLKLFEEIRVLDHPRYIMQYKLRKIDDYIAKYMAKLSM
jgi:hypothetical protein